MHSLISGVMVTHRGLRRAHNEDAIGYDYPSTLEALDQHGALFMLADGVGGLKQGELYSAQTITRLPRLYHQAQGDDAEERLVNALQTLNGQLYQQQLGGATTFVGAVIIQEWLIIAQVGDSRAYMLDGSGRFLRLTEDHLITLPDGRRKLTRALGHKASVIADTISGPLPPNSRLLLCSDGLTRYLDDEALARLCNAEDLAYAAEKAVRLACKRGGTDNISLMILEVGPPIRDQEALTRHLSRWQPLLELPDDLGIVPDMFRAVRQAFSSEAEPTLPSATPEVVAAGAPLRRVLPPAEAASAGPRVRPSDVGWPSDQEASPKRKRRRRLPILLLSLLLMIVSGAGVWLALNSGLPIPIDPTPPPIQASATLTSTSGQTVPATQIAPTLQQFVLSPEVQASAMPTTPAPEPQASATSARERFNGSLRLDDRLRFAGTGLTFLRLDGPSSAFSLQPDRIYRLDDIVQAASDGRTWLRLQDSETERYGWIPLDSVPDYEILLP
ncbi:MAG: protein phosphatase 2C domain-containing protein [Anaerolineae bacterium]|nr:protein phosphatase 2C domain-containing protein [Anaerolineae bacterium]MDW8171745.1 protein phosphatase 2C domain-containing protein [Anaerolineae bacterium]